MSNLVKYAEKELALLGMSAKGPKDDPDTWMAKNILQMVRVFSKEGHSGSSASYCIAILEKLLRFDPLKPLTGEENEWIDHGYCFQNTRCSHVFKEDGQAYDNEGKIFREPDGSCFTNFNSRVPVTFPYVPKCEYVDVPARTE